MLSRASRSKVEVNTEANRTKPHLTYTHAVRGLTARQKREASPTNRKYVK